MGLVKQQIPTFKLLAPIRVKEGRNIGPRLINVQRSLRYQVRTVCRTLCRQFHCHRSSHASIKRTFREIIPLQIYPQQLDGTSLQYVYRTQLKTGIQVVPHTTQDLPPQKAERKPPLKSVAARLGSNFLHMTVHSRSASIRFLKGNRAALQLSSC